MNLIKQNLLPIDKNGEPGTDFIRCQGRRVCSTCLSEKKKPVMAKLSLPLKQGRDLNGCTQCIPYLESLKRLAEVSDETITCLDDCRRCGHSV
jgi:hypothetical protein